MRWLRTIAIVIGLSLCCPGCATLQESRGDHLEDTRKIIYDTQHSLRNLRDKSFIIKDLDKRGP